MKRIALLSDTHNLLRPEVVDGIDGVEAILHMGDFCRQEILDQLQAIAPVSAVRGNCDFGLWAQAIPHTASVDVFGAGTYLVHNIADLDLDPAEAGLRFVLYGHSHSPKQEEHDGVIYLNPGSIGPIRFNLPISYALLHEDLSVEFVEIPRP